MTSLNINRKHKINKQQLMEKTSKFKKLQHKPIIIIFNSVKTQL